MIQGSYGVFHTIFISSIATLTQSDQDPRPGQVAELVQHMIKLDFFFLVTRSMHQLSFLGRKDAQTIFSHAFRFRPENSIEDTTLAIRSVLDQRPEVVVELCRGYEHKESAMPCGTVLREILKFKEIIAVILYDQSHEGETAIKYADIDLDAIQSGEGVFWKFFEWIDKGAFEVSADAFTTFRVSAVILCSYLGKDLSPCHRTYSQRRNRLPPTS